LVQQYKYILGKNEVIEGGPNLIIGNKESEKFSTLNLIKYQKETKVLKDKYLYHLLTNTESFNIGEIKFYDYNACIDLFLEKNT
jgi:hypothetical protein